MLLMNGHAGAPAVICQHTGSGTDGHTVQTPDIQRTRPDPDMQITARQWASKAPRQWESGPNPFLRPRCAE